VGAYDIYDGESRDFEAGRRGRVRVQVERQQALLDEFEKSGAGGAKFARLAGIKYATFAGWLLKRRRQRGRAVKTAPSASADRDDAV